MANLKVLAWIKKTAAILLAICFVLPLSRCESKVAPRDHAAPIVTHLVGYELATDALSDFKEDPARNVMVLLAVFNVFFVPIISLRLKERPQAGIYVLSSFASAYILSGWVFVWATKPEIGGVVAITCWALLFVASTLTFWAHWRGGRFKGQPV